MAEPQLPNPPHRGTFTRALFVAFLVAVFYGALLLAVDGVVSLLLDRDVIVESDAGPLVGPIMAMTAIAIVFVSTLGGLRPASGPRSIPVARAASTIMLVYLLGPLVGSMAYVLGQEQLFVAIHFYVRYLVSPFVVASAVLAGLTILFLPLIAGLQSRVR